MSEELPAEVAADAAETASRIVRESTKRKKLTPAAFDRIVACVNACRGIPTDVLVSGKIVAFSKKPQQDDGQIVPMKGGDRHEERQEEAQGR